MAIDLEKLENNDGGGDNSFLGLLISVEDVLDSNDAYTFKSWIDGEVVAGPIVKRHWVGMSLLYPYHKMPDPRFCLRLMKLGVKVEYNHMHKNPSDSENEYTEVEDHEENKDDTYWLVELTFPRRLLTDMAGADVDMYDDEVDSDTVEDAKDSGINDESAYQTDEQLPGGDPMQDPNAHPDATGGPGAPPR